MAIRSKLVVNETYIVHVENGSLFIADIDGEDLIDIDLKDAPELIEAMMRVMSEHNGNTPTASGNTK